MRAMPVKRGHPVQIRNVMTSNVATVSPLTPLVTVCKMMRKRKISCVLVMDGKKILGIISERDLVRTISRKGGDLIGSNASDAMSSPVETLTTDVALEKAVQLMRQQGYRRFPILNEDGALIGIVTRSDVLRTFTRELEIAHEEMKDLAIRDYLTGLYNRRFFMAVMEKEFYRSKRYDVPLSLILLDIDDFKKFNDLHGHQYGDQILMTLSEILKRLSRTSDIISRFGGEEFTIIVPNVESKQAAHFAERLRAALQEAGITVSVGVISFPEANLRFPDDLIRRADAAMYYAKEHGKNRVKVWDNDMEKMRDPDSTD